MEHILRRLHKTGIFGWLYVMTLLHAFHFFATHFIHSSFLEQYLSSKTVGFIIALSSLFTVLALLSISRLLQRFGAYKVALVTILIDFVTSLGLAFLSAPILLYTSFVIQGTVVVMTLFCFDIFLENLSEETETVGFFRGIFLTMSMIASLFAPVISGFLIGDSLNYNLVYVTSALYLIPTIFLLLHAFKDFSDPTYELFSVSKMFTTLKTNRNILNISYAQFLLRFFFSWMVVYLPIYLHKYIGFSWSQIGVLLFIMILPYIIIEFPAGVLADRFLGEKELLFVGFCVTAVSTFSLFFIHSNNIVLWGALLFSTRIGAALIESMSETYFFKQIQVSEVSILSIFRMLRPFAYIVGPLFASALLFVTSMEYLWIVLAVVVSSGMFTTLFLKDTR